MDPITMAALASTAANVGSALLGKFLSGASEEEANKLFEEAYQLYGSMEAPALEKVLAGKLGPSALSGLPSDFGNKSGRNLALSRIIEMGTTGGLDAEGLAANEQARRAAALQVSQAEKATLANAERRGLRGAGVTTAALQSQQAANDRLALADMQGAADARSRALQALGMGFQGAQSAESADYAQAANRAQTEDAIARFNAELAEQAKYHNAGLVQQNFQNQLALADKKYMAKVNQAQRKQGKASQAREMVGGIGQAIGSLGGPIGQMAAGGGAATRMPVPNGPAPQFVPVDSSLPGYADPYDPTRRR